MGFKIKKVYFADHPYDIPGVDWLDFLHVRNKVDARHFTREEWTNAIIDLKKGEDKIWSNMASKCRADIRKAEKDDIQTYVNQNLEEFIQLNRSDSHNCCLLVNKTFMKHIHCHIECSQPGPLSYTALQHPKLTVLYCEFNVLHIVEMFLKILLNRIKFTVYSRHCCFKR